MDIRDATEAFTAMDAYGYAQTTIPVHAILHSVGDGSGFRGRISAGKVASFVYLGSLFYARKDAVETKTKPMDLRRDASATFAPGVTSNRAVKLSVPALVLLAALGAVLAFAQTPPNEPTKQEIAQAYRSKSGAGGTFVPGVRWERWRIKEVRGWKLHFKRISEKRSPGIMTLKYEAVARKNGSCAEYEITDMITFPPPNPQMPPILVVEPNGVKACR